MASELHVNQLPLRDCRTKTLVCSDSSSGISSPTGWPEKRAACGVVILRQVLRLLNHEGRNQLRMAGFASSDPRRARPEDVFTHTLGLGKT
jgi:hypothetical protein